jgi:hypothetical protein
MDLKSFLLALGIFCGGYVSNTLLDEVVDAAEKYSRPDLRLLQNRFQWLHHLQPREAKNNQCRYKAAYDGRIGQIAHPLLNVTE